jgi:hypothetical protein
MYFAGHLYKEFQNIMDATWYGEKKYSRQGPLSQAVYALVNTNKWQKLKD